jgi:hypothetical protein
MTKNDYEMVARVIKRRPLINGSLVSKEFLVNELCKAFLNENYRFNEKKFREAYGEEVEEDEDSLKCSRR